KRIEIDAIEVMYGIQPFIDYALMKIEEECQVWDLSRIGVDEFELEEPEDHYDTLVNKFERNVGRAYGKKLNALGKSMNKIIDVVKDTTKTLHFHSVGLLSDVSLDSFSPMKVEPQSWHLYFWNIPFLFV
ncbi:unnamed protein product, partial [marine sediment metagenome]